MTDVDSAYEDFIASGRSGRRNAIHKLPGSRDHTPPSRDLARLDISKPDGGEDSGKSQDPPAKEEERKAEGS